MEKIVTNSLGAQFKKIDGEWYEGEADEWCLLADYGRGGALVNPILLLDRIQELEEGENEDR